MRFDNNTKFDEALTLLNDAAKEGKGDFLQMLSGKYENIKDVLSEFAESKKEAVESTAKSVASNHPCKKGFSPSE